ncbi:hypothetical protein N9L68_07795 [bacterium]|nr:hypothetical protein [bacterium]
MKDVLWGTGRTQKSPQAAALDTSIVFKPSKRVIGGPPKSRSSDIVNVLGFQKGDNPGRTSTEPGLAGPTDTLAQASLDYDWLETHKLDAEAPFSAEGRRIKNKLRGVAQRDNPRCRTSSPPPLSASQVVPAAANIHHHALCLSNIACVCEFWRAGKCCDWRPAMFAWCGACVLRLSVRRLSVDATSITSPCNSDGPTDLLRWLHDGHPLSGTPHRSAPLPLCV